MKNKPLYDRVEEIFTQALIGCPYYYTDDGGYKVYVYDWMKTVKEMVLEEIAQEASGGRKP